MTRSPKNRTRSCSVGSSNQPYFTLSVLHYLREQSSQTLCSQNRYLACLLHPSHHRAKRITSTFPDSGLENYTCQKRRGF